VPKSLRAAHLLNWAFLTWKFPTLPKFFRTAHLLNWAFLTWRFTTTFKKSLRAAHLGILSCGPCSLKPFFKQEDFKVQVFFFLRYFVSFEAGSLRFSSKLGHPATWLKPNLRKKTCLLKHSKVESWRLYLWYFANYPLTFMSRQLEF